MKIQFRGYHPFLRQMRTDGGFRVDIETGLDQYKNIAEIPLLSEGEYVITIENVEEVKETNS